MKLEISSGLRRILQNAFSDVPEEHVYSNEKSQHRQETYSRLMTLSDTDFNLRCSMACAHCLAALSGAVYSDEGHADARDATFGYLHWRCRDNLLNQKRDRSISDERWKCKWIQFVSVCRYSPEETCPQCPTNAKTQDVQSAAIGFAIPSVLPFLLVSLRILRNNLSISHFSVASTSHGSLTPKWRF